MRGVGTPPKFTGKKAYQVCLARVRTFRARKGVDRNPYIVCICKQLTDELFAVTNIYEVDTP